MQCITAVCKQIKYIYTAVFCWMICSDDIKTLGANKRREKEITESKENEPKRKKKQTKVIHSTQQLMMVCSVAGVARPSAGLQGMTRIHQCQKRMPPYWYRCVNGTLLFLPSFLLLFPYFLFVCLSTTAAALLLFRLCVSPCLLPCSSIFL